jgi:hypothetical protein
MSYSNRIFFYGPVGLLLLLVVLYSVYWRVQTDTLAARLDRANGGEVIPGVVLTFAAKTITGYPFQLDVVLSGVTFSHQAPEGETAWRTEQLALHALSYRDDQFLFEVTGLQSFSRPPLTPGGPPRFIYLTPAIARASAFLNQGRLVRFDLDLLEPQGKDATNGANPKRVFSAGRAQIHFLARVDRTVDVALKIDDATIGPGYAAGGTQIQLPLIDLRGQLTKGEALDALRSGETSLADAATAWRGGMGALSVSDLALRWPDAQADLKGDLTLNEAGLPSGTLKGEGLRNGKVPAEFGLTFADGDMRLAASAAPARPAH